MLSGCVCFCVFQIGAWLDEGATSPIEEKVNKTQNGKRKGGRQKKRGKQLGTIERKLMAHLRLSALLLFKGLWREGNALK